MTVTDRKMRRQKNVTNNKRKKMLKNTIEVLKKKRVTDNKAVVINFSVKNTKTVSAVQSAARQEAGKKKESSL